MDRRFLVPMSALAAATAAVLLAPSPVAGQANTRVAAKTWAVPHTANGQPDLQGLWTNATITPFERPKDLAGKESRDPTHRRSAHDRQADTDVRLYH